MNAAFLGVALLALPFATAGAEIDALSVEKQDGRYRVEMDVRLATPPARSYAAFIDYARLPDMNPAVHIAQLLPGDTADPQLYTEVRVCAALLCKTMRQVQHMHAEATGETGGRLTADVLPERSDLRYGHAEWRFTPQGRETRLQLSMELEPAFWVPPLIGPLLIEHALREEAQRTSAGIERVAAQDNSR